MKVLFICNQNKHRSKTAEALFTGRFETKSAGLYSVQPVSKDEVSWADLVVVMDDEQRTEISRRFPILYLKKRILNLNIPDIYNYNQPELIKILNVKFNELLSTH